MLITEMRRLAPRILVSALVAFASPSLAYAQSNSLADPGINLPSPAGINLSPGSSIVSPDGLRRGTLAPVSPSSTTKTVLSLQAFFFDGSDAINTGLRWRIFSDQADVNGNHALVLETTDSRPLVTLDPGGYIVHVSYGLATVTRPVVLGTGAESQRIVLNAGAIRFTGSVANKAIPAKDLSFEIHRTDGEMERLVADRIKAGDIVRLSAGSYQITSTYGQANARIVSEVRVEPGKLTDAAVLHKAAHIALRLVGAGGIEVKNANWNILTPGGDAVTDTLSNTRDVILAEGEYVAVARVDGQPQPFQKPFAVTAGKNDRIDVLAR